MNMRDARRMARDIAALCIRHEAKHSEIATMEDPQDTERLRRALIELADSLEPTKSHFIGE